VHEFYAGSEGIIQAGGIVDYRFGVLRDLGEGRSLEVLALHHRIDMTHDVAYLDWFWDPDAQMSSAAWRVEHNEDRTRTWGLHLGYVHPIQDTGYRTGFILTANHKSHPKIPNYEIMNIPRDPGYTWAFNIGAGFSGTEGPATFGLEVIYEPIWSDTWADTPEPVETQSGGVIPAGGRTVENDFRFHNARVRMGLGRDFRTMGFQLGLDVRSIRYDLEQENHVEGFLRNQRESWMEWTPSWGASLRFPEFELRYVGRTTTGTGRPGVALGFGNAFVGVAALDAADFIVAPSGPLTLQDARVLTHQVSVSIPLRDGVRVRFGGRDMLRGDRAA
jgi:hypothetical protein